MAQENISVQLNDLLASRDFRAELLDREGRPTDAENADIFTFDYVSSSGKDYGTMVIILDTENEMQVFYGDNLGRSMEGNDKNEFFDFVQHLHKFANMRRWTYSPKNINQVKYTMQGLAAIKEGLFEGYYGTRKVSYSGEPTQARLVIQHNRPLGETDARYRYVESLFIETADSQRFKLQFKNLTGARAMLEHVRQGGFPYDVRGSHITETVNEIATLSRFNRASAGRVLEGITAELVTEAQTYYKRLRENMKRMASPRGYNAYFETWHPATIDEQQELVEDIKTLFIEQTLDTRIEAALPLLARIQQQGNAMKEAQIFENWINNLAEGTWSLPETPEQLTRLKELMSRELIVGPDATNATEQLYDLVGDDILFDRLSELAEKDPRANAFDDTEVMNRLAELGIQMPEPSEPGNPAEPATAPVAPVAAAPAAPAVPPAPVAEDSPLDRVRQRVHAQGFTDSPEERTAARQRANQRHQANLDRISNIGGLGSDEEAKHQAQQRMARDAYDTQRRKDDDEDTRKTFDMFRDRLNRMQYKNQRDVDPEQLAKISAIKYESTEGTSRGVDAKGRTQSQWIQMVKAKFPDGKMIQAKMPDGPVQVTLPDGRKLGWSKVEQAVAEGPAVDAYMSGKSPALAHFADQLDKSTEQGMTESTELNTMLKYAGVPVAESRVLDEAGETIDHILNRFKHEVGQFEQGNDLDSDLYDALFDYYSDKGEIPYGIAKARTGDPFSWVSDKLANHLGVNEGWKGAIAGGLAGGALGSVVPALGTLAGAAAGAYAGHKLGDQGFKDPDAEYKKAQKLKQTQQLPVDEADAISTFEVMSGFDAPVAEGSCNMTAEGAYCPEHGLAECGGGMYESRKADAVLARIKSLALLK